MKNVSFVILGIMIGAMGVFFIGLGAQNQTDQSVPDLAGAIRYNCELSGGEIKDDHCECSIEAFQTQEEMYDKVTGFCQSTIGGPAGEAFEASIGLPRGYYSFWTNIIVKLCEESGGSLSGAACKCPSDSTYSQTTGQCE